MMMMAPQIGGIDINLACVGVATVNLAVSVMAWAFSSRRGTRRAGADLYQGKGLDLDSVDRAEGFLDNLPISLQALTAIIALVLFLLTLLYFMRSDSGKGGGLRRSEVTVEELRGTLDSLDLPNLPPGTSDVRVKRVCQTEEIFIQNKAAGDGAATMAAPYDTADYGQYRTIENIPPTSRPTGTVEIQPPTRSLPQQPTLEESTKYPSAHQDTIAQPSPTVLPPQPDGKDDTYNMQQVPVQDLGSQPSTAESIPREAIVVPIRVSEPWAGDKMVTDVDQMQVQVLCPDQQTTTAINLQQPTGRTGVPPAAAPTQKTETRFQTICETQTCQQGQPIIDQPSTVPSVTPTMKALPITDQSVETASMSPAATVAPQPGTFEAGADVYFKIEEARYCFVPDPDAPGGGTYQAVQDTSAPFSVVQADLGQAETRASMKQLPIQVMDSQLERSVASCLSPSAAIMAENTCSKIYSKCRGLKLPGGGGSWNWSGSPDGACRTLGLGLLIAALVILPLFFLFDKSVIEALKKLIMELPADLYRGILHWIDDLDECPSAVGFAFGVIFVSVILGSAYYYDSRDIVDRKSAISRSRAQVSSVEVRPATGYAG